MFDSIPDISIIYSRKDTGITEDLGNTLNGYGWNVWWDKYILAGQDFRKIVTEKLKASKHVIVLWTTHSINDSDYVIDEASASKDKLIPIQIGNVTLPHGFGRIHTIKWQGNYTEKELNELLEHLIQYMGKPKPKETSYKLEIEVRCSEEIGRNYPLKLLFKVKNSQAHPITIESVSFKLESGLRIASNAPWNKPKFQIEENNYEYKCTINPSKKVSGWLAIDPVIGRQALNAAVECNKVGTWQFRCWLSEQLEHQDYTKNY